MHLMMLIIESQAPRSGGRLAGALALFSLFQPLGTNWYKLVQTQIQKFAK